MRLSPSEAWTTLGLALLGIACSSPERVFIPLDTFDGSDMLFLVEAEASGRVVSVNGPILLDGASGAPRPDLQAGETTVTWMLGYRHQDLRAKTPLYDVSRRAELRLAVEGTDSCPDGALETSGRSLRLPAPTPVGVWRIQGSGVVPVPAEEAAPLQRTSLSLSVPVDPEGCIEPEHRVLSAYADRDAPIELGTVLLGSPLSLGGLLYTRVHRLPDDRILLLSNAYLFLLERGRPFEPIPGRFIPMGGAVRSLLVDEHPTRHGGRIRIVTTHYVDRVDVRGAWRDIELDEGGLTLIEQRDLSESIDDILLDPDTGRIVGAGAAGTLFSQARRGDPIDERPGSFLAGDNIAFLTRTNFADRPYAVSGAERDQVVVISEDLRSAEALPITGLDPASRFRALALLGTPRGPRLFAANNKGELHWFDPQREVWTKHPLRLAPSYECGGRDGCGFQVQTAGLRRLVPWRRGGVDRAYAAVNDCMALLDFRTDGLCAGHLGMPGRTDLKAPEVLIGDERLVLNVRAIDISPSGWLTVASQEGGVYEMYVGDDPAGAN